MGRGLDALISHVASVSQPFSGAGVHGVSERVAGVDLDRPLEDLDAVLDELRDVYLDDAVWFHEPRYLAHLNCPVVIPALVAELFVSAVNSSLDTWDQSAGGTFVERRLVDWAAGRIGFDGNADGVFTSGGTQSNLQALLIARGQAYLSGDADPAEPLGQTLGRFRIFASCDSHFSVQKSANVLGLGLDAVVTIPTDERRRMDPWLLDQEIARVRAAGLIPMAVVATAGTTDFGSIDPLNRVADVCAEHGVWLHVDAAYGGGLLVSTRRRHLIDGIERADSVTIDFHKTFFQPVSSSAVIVRRGDDLRHVTYHADYLNPRSAALPNQVDKSLQTTRRFDALKLWLTLRTMGADAIGDYFDAVIDLAAVGHGLLRDDPDFEVVVAPALSTLVFRFRPEEVPEGVADEVNPRIRRTIAGRGDAVMAGTVVGGRAWLKFTLLNPETTVGDVRSVLDLIREIGRELLDELRTEVR
ncbi:aspartate aminotransferase family protein [Aeromicrobium ginsengisoli]|uniref:Aspartate aminotransferase family protein n=2 Tax=Aeromicrobium ginsengisoli TaxID=363867 RepID=A0A5M4FGI0_9ACTN|nr:aspartate aminotransferase family protein [Aeromicrobium ginsengisoli]